MGGYINRDKSGRGEESMLRCMDCLEWTERRKANRFQVLQVDLF